jgi:uncharacterized protein YecT (DUF1311 family)
LLRRCRGQPCRRELRARLPRRRILPLASPIVARGTFLAAALSAATPASAFDCARASTASEKAICADPAALKADEELGKAYEALLASAPQGERAAVVASEARWLKTRDDDCADQKGAALSACLRTETERRRAFLSGAPEAGPGAPGRLAPVFRIENGGKGKADVDFESLTFPAPANAGERAFNAAVAKFSGNVEEPDKDDPAADRYAYGRTMRLVYASPRFVSAHVDQYEYTGGAHPNSSTANINVDMRAGRELAFADLLGNEAAGRIFDLCTDQVRKQKIDNGETPDDLGDPAELRKNVGAASGDLETWSFGVDAAVIGYDHYTVGAYAEGTFSCTIPYATLRPLVKQDFPLP